MLSKFAPKQADISAPRNFSKSARNLALRKVWLPKLLYDSLPYLYLTAGFAAFFATIYISDWFWILPHYLLFSAACVHFGIAVYRRRRFHRRAARRAQEVEQNEQAGDDVLT
jgi:Flp pilus assembly protein TadB